MVVLAGWNVAGAGGVSIRAARWVALAAWAFSLALVVLGLVLAAANRIIENEIATYTVNLTVAALAFSMVGALVAYGQPKNLVGWLLLGIGTLYATELFAGNYGVYTLSPTPARCRGKRWAPGLPPGSGSSAGRSSSLCFCSSRTEGCRLRAGVPWPG